MQFSMVCQSWVAYIVQFVHFHTKIWATYADIPVQGDPKKLYIFKHTTSLEQFKIKWSRFRQNVPRASGNKDYIAILM